jgi:guanylate kinase
VNSKSDQSRKGKLFVVSGPSGSGKSTLCREAARRTGAALSISATTRPRRETEVEGKDYYFLTEEEFGAQIDAGEFLEYARVFDHYYGTPAGKIQEKLLAGQNVVLEIDVQGAMQVFARYNQACGILVLPPVEAELTRRLQQRGQDSTKNMEKRLAKAQWEIEQAHKCGRYEYTIINDDLEEAIQELAQIIK